MTRFVSRTITCALGALVLCTGTAIAQTKTKADPWRVVPDLPKTCDPANDIGTRLDKAIEANKAEQAKQEKINGGIKAGLDSIDGATKARNMQAYMMKNPQEAMKAMQAAKTASADLQSLFRGADVYKDEEFKGLRDEFNPAAKKAQAPVHLAIDQLIKTRSKPGEGGAYFPDPADQRKFDALQEQLKTEYDKVCMGYLGPEGKLQTWLRAYGEYLRTDVVPKIEEAHRANVLQMVMAMGDAASALQSTAGYEAADYFLKKAADGYGIRRAPDPDSAKKP